MGSESQKIRTVAFAVLATRKVKQRTHSDHFKHRYNTINSGICTHIHLTFTGLTPHVAPTPRTGSGQTQKPGTPSGCPRARQGPKPLGHLPLSSKAHQQGAGSPVDRASMDTAKKTSPAPKGQELTCQHPAAHCLHTARSSSETGCQPPPSARDFSLTKP